MNRHRSAALGILLIFATLFVVAAHVHPARALASPSAQPVVYLPLIFRKHAPVESVFGVRMQHVTDEFGLPEALEAGVRTVNAVTFKWALIEPERTSPPTYDWSSVDYLSLQVAAASGLEVVGTIHSVPGWAQALPGYSCGPIRTDQLDAFAEFLHALVSIYGVHPYHVRHWSIWNEPDVDWRDVGPDSTFGCWGDKDLGDFGGSAYGQMLQMAYPAIKAAAPEAEVIAGSLLLNDPTSISSKFTEGILLGGGGPYFDALAFHAYSYYYGSLGRMGNSNWPGSVTAIPEKVEFLRSVLEQYGFAGKPILSTEASMVIISDNPTSDSLETQAMYVPRAYAEALSLGLKSLVYYSMTDDWEGRNNGLLARDPDGSLVKKPSYYAYKAAATFLSQAYYTAPASGYPQGVEGHAFGTLSARKVDVIWSADGAWRMVTLPAGALAYDRYGASLGAGPIQVGYGPVYVVRP